jgi:ribosomal subunit interface protein
MELKFSGVHVDVSDSLRAHAEERLQAVKTYFDHVLDVALTLVHEGHHHHLHHVELTVRVNGLTLHATGAGIDWYAGVDDAVNKTLRQLEKYKGRLTKHHARRAQFKEKLKAYAPLEMHDSTLDEPTLDDLPAEAIASQLYAAYAPTVVKKDVSKIAPMTVDEAVMQMDLLHKPAYLFLNAGSGQLNMVYREAENTIRWIAPKQA